MIQLFNRTNVKDVNTVWGGWADGRADGQNHFDSSCFGVSPVRASGAEYFHVPADMPRARLIDVEAPTPISAPTSDSRAQP
jgi:hypothetical protein